MLIDSHAHIYDEQYGGETDAIIDGMSDDGLEYIVTVGCDMPSSRICAQLAKDNERILAAVGVHPYDADTVTPQSIEQLRDLALSEKVVAIGEIGLDFHRPGSDRQTQVRAMSAQYDLARELKLPIVFHIRDGFGEFYEFAKSREFPQSAVLHCFSGSAETAEYYANRGFYISFSGTLTYRNAVNLARAAAVVPEDRLLVETDSPYLTPSRKRGTINYPKYVGYVCDKLAEIRGTDRKSMEKITADNAKRLFGIA